MDISAGSRTGMVLCSDLYEVIRCTCVQLCDYISSVPAVVHPSPGEVGLDYSDLTDQLLEADIVPSSLLLEMVQRSRPR